MVSNHIYISSCSNDSYIGSSPVGYFILGIIETVFFLIITVILIRKTFFPTVTPYGGQSILLPLYFSVTVVIVIIGLFIGIDYMLGYEPTNFIVLLCKWVIIRFFSEALSIFFLHVGIGLRSIRNSLILSFMWSTINWLMVIITYFYGSATVFLCFVIFVISTLIIYYLNMWLLPLNYLHRRPAIVVYSLCNIFVLLTQLILFIIYMDDFNTDSTVCIMTIISGTCEFLQLVIILKAFTDDSKFWQGNN